VQLTYVISNDFISVSVIMRAYKALTQTFLYGRQKVNQETPVSQQTERIPIMQRIIDNPFLLLFIGVVVPTVFYVVWGIMELVSIPLAN
jgi:hypothetical protein